MALEALPSTAELIASVNAARLQRITRAQQFYERKRPMANSQTAPPVVVQIAMPLDDDLIAAVGQGVQLERALHIQGLRNQKATLETLTSILAVQKLPNGSSLSDALKALQALQPQAAQALPGGATVAVQKQV